LLTELFSDPCDKLDNRRFERALKARGYCRVVGCDEAGRGPLAGPVVAAAVILPDDCHHSVFQDSKKLTHRQRVDAYAYLREIKARIGIGVVPPETIDRINILQASLLAMSLSVQQLAAPEMVDFILVDGKFEVPLAIVQQTLIKGESRSCSIAAASIVAKVERDKIMVALHEQYPQYNFAKHKGYPTRLHRDLLKEFGPSPVHRRSFKGVMDNGQ